MRAEELMLFLESPLDCKEIQPVHTKGNQFWVFIGRNDAEAETPILWPPHAKSWLIGKDSDARRDWGQEEKGTTEDEMAGWHHRLDGHELEWTPGVWWWTGRSGVLQLMRSQSRTRLSNWTELNWLPRKEWIFTAVNSNVQNCTLFSCNWISFLPWASITTRQQKWSSNNF